MNRDELDAFFTKADDVLADWQGSVDSMNTGMPPESFLRFLDSIEAPSFNHRELLRMAYQDDGYRDWKLSILRCMPLIPAGSPLFIGSVA